MGIKIDDATDFKGGFPQEFQVEFNRFSKDFSAKFSKLSNQDASYPIDGSDIFVIDTLSGNPVKYDFGHDNVN